MFWTDFIHLILVKLNEAALDMDVQMPPIYYEALPGQELDDDEDE